MKRFPLVLVATVAVSLMSGCGKKTPTEVEVTADPAAIAKAFTDAPPEVRQQSQEVARSIQGGDPVANLDRAMRLENQPGLSPEQMREAGRAKAVVLRRVREAAKNGDARAQQAMERYSAGK